MSSALAEFKGFTPVIDSFAAEVGLVTAAVYGVVWRHCQMRDGVCTASLETLAKKVGVDRSTLKRNIKTLCEAGYLEDTTPERRNRPHVYRDTGKLAMSATLEIGGAERNVEEGEVRQSATCRGVEHDQGGAECPTRIPSQETTQETEEKSSAADAANETENSMLQSPPGCPMCQGSMNYSPERDRWECEDCHHSQIWPTGAWPGGENCPGCGGNLAHYTALVADTIGEHAGCECGWMSHPPGRVQLSRARGWRMPPNTVKADRSTRWGNPHFISMGSSRDDPVTRRGAVDLFRRDLEKMRRDDLATLEALLAPLRGKNLACWCVLGKPCHADVWLELIARPAPARCPDCGKPRATGPGAKQVGDCCRCEQQAELKAALGPKQDCESSPPGWRQFFGWPNLPGWLNPDWRADEVKPRQRIDAVELRVLGCLVEHITGLSPAGSMKGYCNGLAAIFFEAHGDWEIITRAIDNCWARKSDYRPRTVAQRVGAAKPNGFAVEAGKLWAEKQHQARPQNQVVQAIGLEEK